MDSRDATNGGLRIFALILIFVLLSVLALAFREQEILRMVSRGPVVTASSYHQRAALCGELPWCLRVADAWVGVAIEKGLIHASRVLDLLPARHDPTGLSLAVKESYLLVISAILTRILGLVPILAAAVVAYRSFLLRLLLMVAVFMSLFGWARKNPLFSEQAVGAYDYPAIGFMFLLFVLIARGSTRSFVKASAALVLGQLVFENLGVVTGVAVALHEFVVNREGETGRARARRAAGRLIGLALVSVMTLGILYLAIALKTGGVGGSGFAAYFREAFDTYGRINIQEFHDIRENFVEILAYPSAAGLILGLLAAFVLPEGDRDRRSLSSQFWAAFAIWIGFMVALTIGFFFSGLYYEMGRQLLPLCAITTLAWAKGIALLAAKARARAGGGG